MKYLVLFFILFGLRLAGGQTLDAVRLNREGADLLKQQNFVGAQDKFLKALGKEPFLASIHLNLGLSFEAAGQGEKAEASYLTALKYAVSDDLRFMALFNLGETMGLQKKVDQALQYYQLALELKPDSEETKVNIELLIQQNQGGGKGQNDKKDKKDQDKNGSGEKKDDKDKNDKKDDKGDKDPEKDQPKQYEKNKPQPRKFKSDDLTQGDVNKILGEIKQQEQKIRQDYNRKDAKERPRGKDW